MEVTDKDSEFCTFYEFPSKAFPRFRYIQDNLISFYPRFRRTVENLPVCLKWKDLMEDISKKVELLEKSMPEVILFGEKHSMIKVEQIVVKINRLSQNEFKTGKFSRKDLPPHVSVDTPQVLVYKCSSDQVEQEIIHLEQELLRTAVDNVFLLLDVRGRSENAGRVLEAMISSFTDTHREFWKDRMIVNTPDQNISTWISNHLEMCLLKEFKRIDDCIAEFISVQRKVASISSLESDLVSAANKFFQNKMVVQDLMNLAYQDEVSDQFLQDQIIWFIQREVLAEFHTQFKMAAGDIHAMLGEMKFEEKCKTNISPTTWLSIKSELSEVCMESQMDINYQRGNRRTYGSQQTAKMLMWDLQPVRKDVERFLQGVQKGLITLRQLKFELNGILKNTIFSQENEAEGIRTVASDIRNYWKEKLMQMDEVQGCGDYFGTWTIFISNQNSAAKELKVRQKIAMCLSRYPYEYDIIIGTTPGIFANPKPGGACNQMQQLYFKAGQKLRWQDEKGQLRYGTLGIFVQGKNEPSVYLSPMDISLLAKEMSTFLSRMNLMKN